MTVVSFIGTPGGSTGENICQPTQAEIAPLSAWKIQERIANASEIRTPTELGIHIADASITNMTGPAISRLNMPAVAMSEFSLNIMLLVCHEPSTSTHAPTITAAR